MFDISDEILFMSSHSLGAADSCPNKFLRKKKHEQLLSKQTHVKNEQYLMYMGGGGLRQLSFVELLILGFKQRLTISFQMNFAFQTQVSSFC